MGKIQGGRGVMVATGDETFTKKRSDIASNKKEEVSRNPLHIPIGIGNVPVEWRWSRLEDVCDGIFDCPHSTPKLSDSGPLMVRTQDILSGVFRTGQAGYVSEETYRERTKRAEPTHGDLFYSREGTYFGIAAEVPRNYRVCLGQRMVLIRPNSQTVDSCYLRFWLNSPVMESHIHGFRDGSVAERLNLPTIRTLPVLLPPPPRTTHYRPHPWHPGRQDRTQPPHERNPRRNGPSAIQELVHRLRPCTRQGRPPAARHCPNHSPLEGESASQGR